MHHYNGNIIRKIVALLMLAGVCILLVNKIIFIHSHRTIDGIIITHYHPYNKSNDTEPFKSHHHSNTEFYIHENLKVLLPLVIIYYAFITLFIPFNYKIFITVYPSQGFNKLPLSRAPPLY